MDILLASHRVGLIWGVEVRLAYSLYFIIGLFALSAAPMGMQFVLAILLLPVFVLLHELGHTFAALRLGVRVHRIVLHMLGGAAMLDGLIPGPRAEILIAAMGPAVSFFLAMLGYLAAGFAPPEARGFLLYVCWANLMLGIFNLLPVFPMDGGRIALAAAVMRLGIERGVRLMRPVSLVGAGLIAFYGIWRMVYGDSSGIFLVLIAGFLYFRGGQEIYARMHAQNFTSGGGYGGSGGSGFYGQGYTRARVVDERPGKPGFIARWLERRRQKRTVADAAQEAELARRVDEVLAKVRSEGIASLSPGERALLHKASDHYRNDGR